MKKVLFVINTMGRAGAEKSMIELMKVMDPGLFELHLFVLINRGEMYEEVPSYVKLLNKDPDSRPVLGANLFLIKTIGKALLKKLQLVRKLPYLIKNLIELKKLDKLKVDKLFWRILSDGAPKLKEHYDIAIAYLEGGAAYYVADHVHADKKAAFIHIDYLRAGYTKNLDLNCYEAMNKVFVISEETKLAFLEIYPQYQDKVEIFHNIINSPAIKKAAVEGIGFTDGYEGIRILSIGRLHPQKAFDIVIPILYILRKEGYEVKWYVIGEGSERPVLEQLIRDYQLTDSFLLMGATHNPYPYLKQCDIYVQASRYEGKSIAIEEAQVLGKAIVASDCSGNREQIQHGENGIIVSLEESEIVKGIKMLLEDRNLRYKLEQACSQMDFNDRYQLEGFYRFIGERV